MQASGLPFPPVTDDSLAKAHVAINGQVTGTRIVKGRVRVNQVRLTGDEMALSLVRRMASRFCRSSRGGLRCE